MSDKKEELSPSVMAERGIIGSILLDPDNGIPLAINERVAEDWFTERPAKLIWYTLTELFRETGGAGVDPITVYQRACQFASDPKSPYSDVKLEYKRDIDQVMDFCPTSAHLEHYIRTARMDVMVRRFADAKRGMDRSISQGEFAVDAMTRFQSRVAEILSDAMISRTKTPASIIGAIMDRYREAHHIRMDLHDMDYTPGIPLPWDPVNKVVNGVGNELIYLGARPSVGKTVVALNLVRFWLEKGYKVGLDCLDMAMDRFMQRPLAEMARVSFNKASFGTTTQADLDALSKAAKEIDKWPLRIIIERDVDRLHSWAAAMIAAGKMDILVVDFVQLLRSKQRFGNMDERMEYISGVLKSIANDYSIPVLALSQLNRECTKDGGRVPEASDLRGSGSLEQDASQIWLLHRESDVTKRWNAGTFAPDDPRPTLLVPNQTPGEVKNLDALRFIVAKNQNGKAGPDIWFPLIAYKSYAAVYLGDEENPGREVEIGHGVSAKKTMDYARRYAKVHADWRHDPLEEVLRRRGVLIELPKAPEIGLI